jgi:uncharacterized protein YndB with AHSA1/START domain
MSGVETRTVETTIEIDAPQDAVWKALTDAKELVRWFPLEAEVEPRVGGRYWISWRNEWQGEHRIRVFEPESHLRTTWAAAVQEGEGLTELAVDYHLEGRGGRTVLRLVHSGFGRDAAWDEEYDGVRLGWTFELRSLRHYLERHRGHDRRAIFVVGAKSGLPGAEVWVRALRDVLGAAEPGALREGDPYSMAVGGGETFSGTVLDCQPPRQFAGTVAALDEALFRVEVYAGRPHLWLAAWRGDGSALARYEARWRQALARALPEGVSSAMRG